MPDSPEKNQDIRINTLKKNRSILKEYFKKGSIPTESNFADLIDSMLNQDEDNISKLPNEPLKITANAADELLLNFYTMENNEEKLTWQVKQKHDEKAGLSISDVGQSRLFIEKDNGNVGIGTILPDGNKLRVEGGPISTNGNLHTQRGRLAFSNTAGDPNHTIYNNCNNIDGEGAWDGMKMNVYAGLDVRVGDAVKNKPLSALRIDTSGNIGIGTTAPLAKLQIVDGAIMPSAGNNESSGILFPRDPGGGGGDRAWMRYYSRGGESMTLAIGIENDPADHISLMSSGNVGIGTIEPQSKLHVEGNLQVNGNLFERLEIIRCQGRGDWTAADHPIMQYFKNKLSGRPVGTMLRAIQDNPGWRGHYWQGWVDADGRIRVIHNYHNTPHVI